MIPVGTIAWVTKKVYQVSASLQGQLGGRHFRQLYAVALCLGQPLAPEVDGHRVDAGVGRAL